jgi:hypothetical protein
VQIDGQLTSGSANGLTLSSGGSTVRGLIITRFPDAGILLIGDAGNTITCNLIGVDALGNSGLGNGGNGIDVFQSDSNTLGGSNTADRNVISGNGLNGVQIFFADENTILGNTIGVDPTGSAARPNSGSGVFVRNSLNTTIGGTSSGASNLISGNSSAGIRLASDDGLVPSPALVQGNRIGTDAAGMNAIPNLKGISIEESTGNTIGGSATGARNLISGNTQYGITVSNGANIKIQGNWIGTDATGLAPLPNGQGMLITQSFSSGSVTVGGFAAGEGNVIGGNTGAGIVINGQIDGTVITNLIGVGADGVTELGNGGNGISSSDSRMTIGGNVIAANGGYGIALDAFLYYSPWSRAGLYGNYVGAAADGSPLYPNALGGLWLYELPGMVEDNVIVGNGGNRITDLGSDSHIGL